MRELDKQELLNIEGGGVNFSGTLISSMARGIETVLNLGRSLGTAIRRVQNGNICSI